MTKCDCGKCEYRNNMWWRGPAETDGLLTYVDEERWNFCPHCGSMLADDAEEFPKRYKITALDKELLPIQHVMVSAFKTLSHPNVLIVANDDRISPREISMCHELGYDAVLELPTGCSVCTVEEIGG
jgi:hypothetical protein